MLFRIFKFSKNNHNFNSSSIFYWRPDETSFLFMNLLWFCGRRTRYNTSPTWKSSVSVKHTPHTCSYVFIIVSETPERCQKLTFQLFLLMQAFDFRVTCFTNFPFSVCFKGKMSFSNKSGEINCFCWKSVWKSLFFSFFLFGQKRNCEFITYTFNFSEEKTCSWGQNTKI